MLNTKILVLAALWFLGLLLNMAANPIDLFLGIALGVVLVDTIGRGWRPL